MVKRSRLGDEMLMPVTAPLQQEILLSWLLLSVSVVVSRRCAFEAESPESKRTRSRNTVEYQRVTRAHISWALAACKPLASAAFRERTSRRDPPIGLSKANLLPAAC